MSGTPKTTDPLAIFLESLARDGLGREFLDNLPAGVCVCDAAGVIAH